MPKPRHVTATRYVTPLREGGSLPGLVEADDDGLYVVKFRGAGQGPRALVAEWLAGEIARAVGLPVPETRASSTSMPRSATRSPTRSSRTSSGRSGGLQPRARLPAGRADVQPGGGARRWIRTLAADVVWLDCVRHEPRPDRRQPEPARLARPDVAHRPRRRAVHPPHVARPRRARASGRSSGSRDHVLLPFAGPIDAADARLAAPARARAVRAAWLAAIPDLWLPDDAHAGDADGQRAGLRPLPRAPAGRARGVRGGGRACPTSRVVPTSTRSSASSRGSSAGSA